MTPAAGKPPRPRRSVVSVVLTLTGAGFGCAALFHAAALLWPSVAEPSPAWRHALFVVINASVAAGLIVRPWWFAHAFSLLTVQQLYSHGTYGWHVWSHEGRVDWGSVIVLIAMPLVTALLWVVRPKAVEAT